MEHPHAPYFCVQANTQRKEKFMEVDLEHGTATQDDSDIVSRLQELDVPEDILREVKEGTLRRDDYTRKRQQESAEVQQLRQQVAYLAGAVQNSRPAVKDDDDVKQFVATLLEQDDSPQNREIAKLLLGLADSIEKKLDRKTQAAVAPVQQTVLEDRADKKLSEYYKKELVAEYGKEVLDLITPEMHENWKRMVLGGSNAFPKEDLISLHPRKMLTLATRMDDEKQNKSQSRHTEGFTQSRSTQPPMTRTARPADRPVANDVELEAKAILRKMYG